MAQTFFVKALPMLLTRRNVSFCKARMLIMIWTIQIEGSFVDNKTMRLEWKLIVKLYPSFQKRSDSDTQVVGLIISAHSIDDDCDDEQSNDRQNINEPAQALTNGTLRNAKRPLDNDNNDDNPQSRKKLFSNEIESSLSSTKNIPIEQLTGKKRKTDTLNWSHSRITGPIEYHGDTSAESRHNEAHGNSRVPSVILPSEGDSVTDQHKAQAIRTQKRMTRLPNSNDIVRRIYISKAPTKNNFNKLKSSTARKSESSDIPISVSSSFPTSVESGSNAISPTKNRSSNKDEKHFDDAASKNSESPYVFKRHKSVPYLVTIYLEKYSNKCPDHIIDLGNPPIKSFKCLDGTKRVAFVITDESIAALFTESSPTAGGFALGSSSSQPAVSASSAGASAPTAAFGKVPCQTVTTAASSAGFGQASSVATPFNFGQPVTSTSPFTFGGTTKPSTTSSLTFGAVSNQSPITTLSLAFGAASKQPSTTVSSLTFGVVSQPSATTSTFMFKGSSSQPLTTASLFTFGKSNTQPTTSSAPTNAPFGLFPSGNSGLTFGNSVPTAPSTVGGFDFGSSSSQPVVSASSAGAFGKTFTEPATSSSGFGGNSNNQTTSVFSFGATPTSTATTTTAQPFNFAAPTTSASPFMFGSQTSPSNSSSSGSQSGINSFGFGSQLVTTAASTTPFQFGAQTATSPFQASQTVPSTAAPFQFGSSQTSNTPFQFGSQTVTTSANSFNTPATSSSMFAFGSSASQPTATSAAGFSFPPNSQLQNTTPSIFAFGNNTSQQFSASPGFSFNNNNNTAAQQTPFGTSPVQQTQFGATGFGNPLQSGFGFGNSTAAPAPQQQPSLFQFGQSATSPQEPSGGFNFGSPASQNFNPVSPTTHNMFEAGALLSNNESYLAAPRARGTKRQSR